MTNIRKEVMARLIEEADAIARSGGDPWRELERRHPRIPIDVVAEACMEADSVASERWWQSIEKTIDGEIIKNALAKKPDDSPKETG